MMIDCHLHVIRRPGVPRNEKGGRFALPGELIEMMDRTGVDKGILLPGVGPECHSHICTSEDVLEIAEQYPDRFIPFCLVDPRAEGNSPSANHSRQLLWYKEHGCKGVGEMTANLAFTDPLVLNFFHHCQACRMPVLFHVAPHHGGLYGLVDELGLPGLERCLKLFPQLVLIGHSQPFWAEISGDLSAANRNVYPKGPVAEGGTLVRLLRQYPNLFADISANSGHNALTRDEAFGPAFATEFHDRLLFGTDICAYSEEDHKQAAMLRSWRDEGRISSETFEDIAWRNANWVLDLGL